MALRVLDYQNYQDAGGTLMTTAKLSDGSTLTIPWAWSSLVGESRWGNRDLTDSEMAELLERGAVITAGE